MSIYEKLFSWQRNIIDSFYTNQNFGLFLDMGLGKTAVSLGFAEKNRCNKVLVITINSKATEGLCSGSWLDWASKADMNYKLLGKYSKFEDITKEDNLVYVVNYEGLFSRSKDKKAKIELKDNIVHFIELCRGQNVALILDESHKVKNIHSMQTLAIDKIKKDLQYYSKSLYTYLLTGTPFSTGYIDLYGQLKMLGCKMTKGTFTDTFCIKGNIPGLLGWQQPIIGYRNVELLYDLIHRYAITIKSDSVIDLPEQTFVYHKLDRTSKFELFTHEKYTGKDIYKESLSRPDNEKLPNQEDYNVSKKVNNPYFRNFDYPSFKWLAETNGTFWLRSRQISIGFQGNAETSITYDYSRYDAIKQFVKDNEDNYVVFYNFTPELVELFKIFDSLGYKVDVYSGEIKNTTNYELYERMSEDDRANNRKNVIIANFASGSTGMNWQLYNHCIIASLPLYKDYEQAIKRVHRIGQTKTVFYHIFYQDNWLDMSMLDALKSGKTYNLNLFESDLDRVNNLIE